ncbi:SusC/RagA family TonB-linked outer membrane protein [Pontibacter actiniarum]|uniref:SusC/RagA family TonB-linked outer membrane protein n=1 Tax=Pontibacter actiniarum TaxID=323450 RepID=A0A1X9YUX6_9BACT|nr:SusC/RagA family TonB-linked outer membrane protein [Pontibacter actiniarum]ARS36679.1 SusC/RagA family TonB-linked outer membrane protein [Pontibacter actiniarum]
MKKILFLCLLLVTALLDQAMAQVRAITGKVVDAATSQPLPGVTVLVKGTTVGTATGADGGYSINVPEGGKTLVFSFIGYQTTEKAIGNASTVNVSLPVNSEQLKEVVVTALGIEKTKNELSFAATSINGDEVSETRQANFTNALSGKVSGVQIQQNNNLGGSTNVIIRGNKSVSGNNQALFVIDGVPVDNSTNNTSSQAIGRGGYDYGNAAADINPDNIASMTVLKGAAATALYGSRAANGVVMITTKKGSKNKGIGVTVNTGANWGFIDKSTYTRYQKNYGSGYPGSTYNEKGVEEQDPRFWNIDIDGDGDLELVVPTTEDASGGAAFNPNLLVYQWNAFDPTSPFYMTPTPWVAAANDPTTFYEDAYGTSHSIAIDGGNDQGSFRVSYGRNSNDGILPNSNITKNFLNLSASYDLVEKLTASASINFTDVDGLGRFGTGYSGLNPNQSFRQWWPVNVDIKQLEDAYFRTGQNMSWNRTAWDDPTPIYTDNPYWTRYENYNNDNRKRYLGKVQLDYKVTDWLSIMGRAALDTYNEMREERVAVGSNEVASYTRYNGRFSETNFDLMANVNKDLNEDFSLSGTIGTNLRDTKLSTIRATTNGGLVIPKLYSLSNSASPILAPVEVETRQRVNGYFASATLGYKELAFLDLASRVDQSSTLPTDNNTYFYPSISGSFVFSELFEPTYGFTYGKIRANYAEVGNMAQPLSVYTTYSLIAPYGSQPLASVNSTRNNPDLEPERTKSWEIGIETTFLDARAGLDVTYYNASSVDQILRTEVSRATGLSYKWINGGEVVNKGFEVAAFGTPVKTDDFSWTINANWTRNRSEVVDLGPVDNYTIASFQGGVTLNAHVGEPFGTIKGPGFVYNDMGQKVVSSRGYYRSNGDANTTIGDINPDWIGGVNNTLKYKGVSLGFLIDVKQGGDVFSLDQSYGLYTGVPESTSFLNDLGNPVRNPISQGGGVILDGVKNVGTAENPEYVKNDIRVNPLLGLGYATMPAEGFVYDASYVKLREVTLGYSLPESVVSKLKVFQGIDLSVYGRNLWIIHKNTPYSDPEEGLAAGTLSLGYQSGAYPTTRNVGFNIRARF